LKKSGQTLVEKINQTVPGKFQSTPQPLPGSRVPINRTVSGKYQPDFDGKILSRPCLKIFYRTLIEKCVHRSLCDVRVCGKNAPDPARKILTGP